MLCGCEDGGVEAGAGLQPGGRCCWYGCLQGRGGRSLGREVLWGFGERLGEEYVRGRNMFGVAGRMVGKDGDVVRAGCVRGGGGAGDCGGGRYRLMGCWEMKTTSCFLRDPHHIP